MMDGIVSTLGFLMALMGAVIDRNLIVIAVFSEMVAGGISMGFGGYLSTKAQVEFFKNQIRRERREIKELPHVERREIEEIYKAKGFKGEELRMVVDRITSDEEVWLDVMMREELGLVKEAFDDPKGVGISMAISYIVGAIAPIIPFLIYVGTTSLYLSFIFGIITLAIVGWYRARITGKGILSVIEVVLIGVIAASLGYIIGIAIRTMI
jgi:VIT1/CCC1 family predicted Fe2+/Mn2+ transporter